MILKRIQITLFILLTSMGLMVHSCKPGEKKDEEKEIEEEIDSNKTALLNINGTLFSIPSPVQTAILIKNLGTNYNQEMLNPVKNLPKYSTNLRKALNLGIYGADLGYVTIYDQSQDAIMYIQAVRKLADELGISSAFDSDLIVRFEKNLSNKDSMINLVTDAYRASDTYLKNNEKNDASALIIAGGWIESLYFTTNILSIKPKSEKQIIDRIAEQKNSLNNLIKLLSPYYNQSEYAMVVDGLVDLGSVFDGVEIKYTFVEPKHDSIHKISYINSTTEMLITKEQVVAIGQKIKKLRAQITE